MSHPRGYNFSTPPEEHEFAALLFDMDGTIIDSTDAIVKHWHQIGSEIGIPGDEILKTSHGRRSIDMLAILAPDRANWSYVCKVEGAIPINYGKDAVEVPGSRALLEKLEAAGAPWAIVTSGTRPLVSGWLDVMKLAHPKCMVTAEEVQKGKPDPECYRMGAEKLGFGSVDHEEEKRRRRRILVLEDAPAGVMAGKAAGYEVVALATTHDVERLKLAGADWIVKDMRSVNFSKVDGKTRQVVVEIRDALVA